MNQMKIYRVEQKNEEPVEVQIIRSSRRSMGLQVKADGTVCARVPMQVMDYAVQEFIEGHAEWIFKKRKLVLSKDNRPDIVYLPEVTEESDRERIQTFIEEKVSQLICLKKSSPKPNPDTAELFRLLHLIQEYFYTVISDS